MVAGFNTPTNGKVQRLQLLNRGPDRGGVQNYALLPWRTAFENIYIAVNAVNPTSRRQRQQSCGSIIGGTSGRCRQKPRNSQVE